MKTKKTSISKTTSENKKNIKNKLSNNGNDGGSQMDRHKMIQEAAYFHAEENKFSGDSVEDWLAAEAEINALLKGNIT